jgi:D-hydroxyproline dehydrogenase subunit beta
VTSTSDLVVVGAGVVGLAHAVEAQARGMSVTIVERDAQPVGASVRNFGHGCFTAQEGEAYTYGAHARGVWLRLASAAGFGARESGTVVVARAAEELACLEELAAIRGRDEVQLLSAGQVRDRVPVAPDGLLGGAFLPRDIRVEQRAAAPAVADWLGRQPGVQVLWGTAVTGVDEGVVHTARGDVHGDRVVVCVGHDLDRLSPAVTERAGMTRCVLQMLQVRPARAVHVDPAVLTGTSMLRYPAFAATRGAQALRARLAAERPELLDAVVNHMLTQLPGGDLTIGDTHAYSGTPEPWSDELLDELLLAETRSLLDVGELRVVRRWRGVYASAPDPFLVAELAPGVTAVSVTSGIGMTTAFGLAPAVLDRTTQKESTRA